MTGADPIDGDSTGDGNVDGDDLADWEAGYGSSLPPTPLVDSFDGTGAANFAALQAAHAAFLGTTDTSLTFTGVSGVITPTQFTVSHGITFSNLDLIGGDNEGSVAIENLDGYDGSYQPDGDTVYANYPNHLQPLTFEFDTPVARVGSFVAIGAQGPINTLTITAFDSTGAILQSLSVPTQSFTDSDNREGLWALSVDAAAIAKVSILNDNPINFGNALILDTLEWSTTPVSGSPLSSSPIVAAPTVSSKPATVTASVLQQADSAALPQSAAQFLAVDRPFWLLGLDANQRVGRAELPWAEPIKRDQQGYQQAVDALFTAQLQLSSRPRDRSEPAPLELAGGQTAGRCPQRAGPGLWSR